MIAPVCLKTRGRERESWSVLHRHITPFVPTVRRTTAAGQRGTRQSKNKQASRYSGRLLWHTHPASTTYYGTPSPSIQVFRGQSREDTRTPRPKTINYCFGTLLSAPKPSRLCKERCRRRELRSQQQQHRGRNKAATALKRPHSELLRRVQQKHNSTQVSQSISPAKNTKDKSVYFCYYLYFYPITFIQSL